MLLYISTGNANLFISIKIVHNAPITDHYFVIAVYLPVIIVFSPQSFLSRDAT